MAACDYAEGGILNDLESGDIAGGCVMEPEWSGVAEKGVYEGLVGCYDSLFLLAPHVVPVRAFRRESLFLALLTRSSTCL